MRNNVIQAVLDRMRAELTTAQTAVLSDVLTSELSNYELSVKSTDEEKQTKENADLLNAFISSKRVEGCSDKTLNYYRSMIQKMTDEIKKDIRLYTTNDIRLYLSEQQDKHNVSKVTMDNLRRVFSSYFAWLENEDYIGKSPVRRIHKIKTDKLVKEVISDESLELLRDSCRNLRDLALIDLLASTGMRVGELVQINCTDIDFHERQCIVFGKGNKEREVYFNARTKLHLERYIEARTDDNPALFVSLSKPFTRLTTGSVEARIRTLGKRVHLDKIHPHKFRRTLATMAIDKGMPIEQVQKLLGHEKIDTTMHYAMVNQANVKISHKKYIG